MKLYIHLSHNGVVAFIDLKSAFDVANKHVILDQLVDFAIKGQLLKWKRGYLSNRKSRVDYKRACSTGGGRLSVFLFNILIHRMLTDLPEVPDTTVTCYADDICIHSTSPCNLQIMLDFFFGSASNCGLITSPEKSRTFSTKNQRLLPEFTIEDCVIPLCRQFTYIGVPVYNCQHFYLIH